MPVKSRYTPAQRAAFGKRMAAMRAAKSRPRTSRPRRRTVSGFGSYRTDAPKRRTSRVNFRPEFSAPEYGTRLGGVLGEGLGELASAFGFGDYQIKENSLMASIQGGGLPSIKNSSGNSVIVRHREYIGDIISGPLNTAATATLFTNQSFSLNPGVAASFPWLATLAPAFEEYRWRGMIWQFRSNYGDAVSSTNASLGNVILATEYNAANPSFESKQQMENYEFSQSVKPSQSVLHMVECARSQTPLDKMYVRDTAVPSGQDVRLYDLGNFQIATQGQQAANSNLGELYCSYEIEFWKPKLPADGGTDIPQGLVADHYQLFNVTSSFPLSAANLQPGSNAGTTASTTTGKVSWVRTNGPNQPVIGDQYMILYYLSGTTPATAYSAATIGVLGGVVTTQWLNSSASPTSMAVAPPTGSTTGSLAFAFIFQVTQDFPDALSFTISFPGTIPTAAAVPADLWIMKIPSNIIT